MPEDIIVAQGLTKIIEKNIVAVDHADFSVKEGELLIEGVDVSTLDDNQLADLRRRIGFVFQFFNLIPRFTAKENVELSMSIADVSRAERRKRAESLLETG